MKKLTNISSQIITTGLVFLGLLLPSFVNAVEYQSVAISKAILYDGPSLASKKIYILGEHYPVEVIVDLGKWIKVRDHFGKLSWIQSKDLVAKRHGIVLESKVDIKQQPKKSAAILGTLEKDVLVQLLTATNNGWIKVKHASGIVGYIPATVLWGI